MFKAELYDVASGDTKTVQEATREALMTTIETWRAMGWEVSEFSSGQ